MTTESREHAPGSHPDLPPPASEVGLAGWLRKNLFSGPINTILTFLAIYLIYIVAPPVIDWGIFSAHWTGSDRTVCDAGKYVSRITNGYSGIDPTALGSDLDRVSMRNADLATIRSGFEDFNRKIVGVDGVQVPESLPGVLAGMDTVALQARFEAAVAARNVREIEAVGREVEPLLDWADGNSGACWVFISEWRNFLGYGFYDKDQQWRINLTYIVALIAALPLFFRRYPYKAFNAVFLIAIYPLFAFYMFHGGELIDLAFDIVPIVVLIGAIWIGINPEYQNKGWIPRYRGVFLPLFAAVVVFWVFFRGGFIDSNVKPDEAFWPIIETSKWGGVFLTLIIGVTGIVGSLPLGILLALGRRSNMPVIRSFCVVFIEFWRGVPLITVLFMSFAMFPLFVPKDIQFDQLARALLAVMFFSSAYMAEVVRGGLQAIPKGQYEAGDAMGLSYWQSMGLIVLPQALKLVIPGIVNTFIGLFKDTTLVLVISLLDLLGSAQAALTNNDWLGFHHEAYVFVAVFFWIFCFGMSRYSMAIEKKLKTDHR